MKIVYFILIIANLVAVEITADDKDPGNCICYYFGDLQGLCDRTNVEVCELAEVCSSYVWEGFDVDSSVPGDSYYNSTELQAITMSDKPSYVSINHASKDWKYEEDYANDVLRQEISMLQTIMVKFPNLDGIVFSDVNLELYKDDFSELSSGFGAYFGGLKASLPDMMIGLVLVAGELIDYIVDNESGFDCSKFENFVDFILISFPLFNKCTPDLIADGTIPFDGPQNHTLLKLKTAIDLLNLTDYTQIVYKFPLYAYLPGDTDVTWMDTCLTTHDKICTGYIGSDYWCADNSATLYEKGVFAKQNGGGVAVDSIDLDDPFNACQCAQPFPGVNFLMDGFTGRTKEPVVCKLYDRQ